MEPLSRLQSTVLCELYIANNAIQEIEVKSVLHALIGYTCCCQSMWYMCAHLCSQGVSHLTDLRLLELGSNKIRHMEGLQGLANLHELWLGRNRISHVTSLDG